MAETTDITEAKAKAQAADDGAKARQEQDATAAKPNRRRKGLANGSAKVDKALAAGRGNGGEGPGCLKPRRRSCQLLTSRCPEA